MRKLIAVSALAFFSAAAGASQTWHVDATNDGDPLQDGSIAHPFARIQPAIDVAIDADIVLVNPGTYFETVDFRGKNVLLTSRDGPQTTTIDGRDQDACVVFLLGETRAAIVEGFTFTNGFGANIGTYQAGGGVRVFQASPTIRRNIFIDNFAHYGGGIDAEQGNPLILENVFLNNQSQDNHFRHVTGDGGAISIFDSSAEIVGNAMLRNSARRQGGAICVQGGSIIIPMTVVIANNVIAENTVTDNFGGAISVLTRGDITVRGNTIVANSAPVGNGIYAQGSNPNVTISGSIVYANGATPPATEIVIAAGATGGITYSNVEGGTAGISLVSGSPFVVGTGLIDADPQFVADDASDYRVRDCSPCVHAGDPAYVAGPGERDAGGAARVFAGRVDIGAFERVYGDCNGNGVPNSCECVGDLNDDCAIGLQDLANLLSRFGSTGGVEYADGDLDRDGDVDLQDLASLLSAFGSTCS